MSDPLASAPIPPWLYAKGSAPYDGRWRQGNDEPWFLDVWLPFWRGCGPDLRQDYLDRYPAPDEEWLEYLTEIWVPDPASDHRP